jgi:hypothetical protein
LWLEHEAIFADSQEKTKYHPISCILRVSNFRQQFRYHNFRLPSQVNLNLDFHDLPINTLTAPTRKLEYKIASLSSNLSATINPIIRNHKRKSSGITSSKIEKKSPSNKPDPTTLTHTHRIIFGLMRKNRY